ncbi:hypothetical protein M758_7G014300 [Ceratodon purpureus]|nr:hypothetical protein M758_7G014300 [Ceratodon purpureus]
MDTLSQIEWESTHERKLKDTLHGLLKDINQFGNKQLGSVVDTIVQLLVCNPRIAKSLLNVLHYYLERFHTQHHVQKNIILVIHGVVLQKTNFIHHVVDGIVDISFACGINSSTPIAYAPDRLSFNIARSYLHDCIVRWQQLGIVSNQFLSKLKAKEQSFKFIGPPPNFPPPQDEAPSNFDRAMLELAGRGMDKSCLSPRKHHKFVQDGMKQGVMDGWLHIDENGHYKVRIEEALQ